jgi:hypothetical protein
MMPHHPRMRHLLAAMLLLAPVAADFDPALAGSVEGRESYLSVSVPLPPGKWEVVDDFSIPNPRYANYPISQEILVSRSGKVIDRVVRIWVQRITGGGHWVPYHPCDASGFFYSEIEANSGDQLDCWHVRELSLGLGDDPEPGNKVLADFGKKNGLFVPVVMIGARFARIADSNKRYYVEYLWTPDLLMPANTAAKVWKPEDWTVDAVQQDPTKQALVTAITDWAKDWNKRLH